MLLVGSWLYLSEALITMKIKKKKKKKKKKKSDCRHVAVYRLTTLSP